VNDASGPLARQGVVLDAPTRTTSGGGDGAPRPPRRTMRSDLRRLVGSPARRARLLLAVTGLVVVVAGPVVARSGVSEARVEVRAQAVERSGAADLLEATEGDEADATEAEAEAERLAAEARAARNEQRHRLAALGLNEQTIDAFLDRVTGNAEQVEFERDREVGVVDRQAAEIPTMEECVRVASQTLNSAFNRIIDPNTPVPGPSEVCTALLAAAGT
jgi:hypothetical protein